MIEFAQWNMRRQLSALWQEAFGDPKRIPDFFLNNIFSPRDCVVFQIGGEIASAVYLLPSFIVSDGKKVPAHYIFAAATARKYRSRGYMSALLAYASIAGAKRGDHFQQCFRPARIFTDFMALPVIRIFMKSVRLKSTGKAFTELQAPAKAGKRVLPDIAVLNRLRKNCLLQHGGSLLWDDRMFCLSVAMSAVYGDKLVCASGTKGPAYALCRVENASECTVLESFVGRRSIPKACSGNPAIRSCGEVSIPHSCKCVILYRSRECLRNLEC